MKIKLEVEVDTDSQSDSELIEQLISLVQDLRNRYNNDEEDD